MAEGEQVCRYPADEIPGFAWRSVDEAYRRPAPPVRPAGWRAWGCTTGKHRYHRTRSAAYACAGVTEPRHEHLEIIGGGISEEFHDRVHAAATCICFGRPLTRADIDRVLDRLWEALR